MTVQRMIGASALAEAMRRDGGAGRHYGVAAGGGPKAERQRPATERRYVPTMREPARNPDRDPAGDVPRRRRVAAAAAE